MKKESPKSRILIQVLRGKELCLPLTPSTAPARSAVRSSATLGGPPDLYKTNEKAHFRNPDPRRTAMPAKTPQDLKKTPSDPPKRPKIDPRHPQNNKKSTQDTNDKRQQHNTTQHNTSQHSTTQHNKTQQNYTEHNTPHNKTPGGSLTTRALRPDQADRGG